MFMINAGTEEGIKPDSIVVSGNGLVGRIAETGEGFSKVVSITDENVNVSFEVLRDMSILGIVNGSSGGNIEGFTLKDDAGIVEGDMLVTTGIGMYPEGIEIGKVTEVKFDKATQLLTVKAGPVVDFRNIRKVMVLVK